MMIEWAREAGRMSIEWVEAEGRTAKSRTVHLDLARRATEQYPASAPAWYALAEGHSHNQDFADVAAASRRAIALVPPTTPQLLTYARALLALNRADDALAALAEHAPEPVGPDL